MCDCRTLVGAENRAPACRYVLVRCQREPRAVGICPPSLNGKLYVNLCVLSGESYPANASEEICSYVKIHVKKEKVRDAMGIWLLLLLFMQFLLLLTFVAACGAQCVRRAVCGCVLHGT